jgi:hypothetical protein
MSINRLISIRNPIIDAMDMVGADRSVDMPVFTNWAVQAEKEIASRFAMVVSKKVLTIHGCAAELPCCAVILQRAIMGDHGCDCDSLFSTCFQGAGNYFINNTNQYSSGFLIVDYDPNSVNYFNGFIDYQVQNNQLIFRRNLDGKKVTIEYVGYQEDENGFIMISENHTRAITEFILWKYGVRSEYSARPLSPAMTIEHKREWFRLCKHSRAQDNILTESDREEIAQVINNPYKGRGLWVGMYPTGYSYY